MLEQFSPEVRGKLAVELQEYIAGQAVELLQHLLVEAAKLWESEAYSRYVNDELSCTVRIFDCADRVLRTNEERWPLIRVQYDGTQPTREMRAGLANPKKAPRPDINVFLGSALIHIEAKILKLKGGYPRKYVTQGMRRFVTGHYNVGPAEFAAMLGYVLADSAPTVVAAVNSVIDTEPDFGSSARLIAVDQPNSTVFIYRSDHSRFWLHHQLLDLAALSKPAAK